MVCYFLKLILSRKWFDSGSGGIPSTISSDDVVLYDDLNYKDKIIKEYDNIKEYYWHRHADNKRQNDKLNAIYLPSANILDFDMKSYRLFNYLKELVLTKEGYSRSHWKLPKCLIGKNISYHKESSYKKDYFQSVMCGKNL